MSTRDKRNRTSLARREDREKGPIPSGKCPVVSSVTSGPRTQAPVVSPTTPSPVVSPPSTYMAPVVSPTNGQVPGKFQIATSHAGNNGWAMIQQGGQYQAANNGINNGRNNGMSNGMSNGMNNGRNNGMNNGRNNGMNNGMNNGINNGRNNGMSNGMNNGRNNGMSNGTWSQQQGMNQNVWKPDPEVRTSTGRVQTQSNTQNTNGMINLNEPGQSYLMVDPDGRIVLVRNNSNYQLAGDDQGRIPLQVDGQCGVWIQLSSEQVTSSGPSVAQMIRGQEGNQIINGMQSSVVQSKTPSTSFSPNWYQQQIASTSDNWYAAQW